jgi:hypothetical protein
MSSSSATGGDGIQVEQFYWHCDACPMPHECSQRSFKSAAIWAYSPDRGSQ